VNLQSFNAFCSSLPHTSHVVQWGGADVWKVATKVFAIARDEGGFATSFKCSPFSFDLLKTQKGLRPAPYLASRGMKWIQYQSGESMDDAALQDYLRESHRLASLTLTKKIQKELGLNQA
jgi:predicted DNA-binding protein (MmcQ/YjbR family)